jgi:hypothetical protein
VEVTINKLKVAGRSVSVKRSLGFRVRSDTLCTV